MKFALALASVAVSAAISLAPAWGETLRAQNFKVVGIASTIPASIYDEVPFWRETLPKVSEGKLTAEITPLDMMGINDASMLRLLKLGVMDFAGLDITKMAADDPRFEACDLAGTSTDVDTARKACDAYRDVLDERMEKNWNAKLLAIGANTPQVFWCRDDVKSLSDLKGKKIRVFNNTLRDFVGGIGATSVSIAFSEVVPALNNGVVDCAVTGTLSGNTAGWPEIAKSVYMLPIGWSFNAVAVNKAKWDKLDPATRTFLAAQFHAYEDKMWNSLKAFIAEADACNTGKGTCTMGKPAAIVLNRPSAADIKQAQAVVESVVLPGWAKRCGPGCDTAWNQRVGKVLGLTAAAK